MSDHDALVRAICAEPDDDTPRQIYADFLEEHGEAARAAFIRAQVQAARLPIWAPFSVFCRHRRPEWNAIGEPFRGSLPELPASGMEWPDRVFWRGLGARVSVRSLHDWNRVAPRLLKQAPIRELDLNPPSIRDDWREFAHGGSLGKIRTVRLDGPSPVEPIRALCESPDATGIREIHFQRASSPGMPELLADLFQTPLGKALTGLHFRIGFEAVDHFIDALIGAPETELESLSFQTMGISMVHLNRLFQSRLTSNLRDFAIYNSRLDQAPEGAFAEWLDQLPQSLEVLRLVNAELSTRDFSALGESENSFDLRVLDLSQNPAANQSPSWLFDMGSIRALEFRAVPLTSDLAIAITRLSSWRKLALLDLRGARLHRLGTRILAGSPPPELTAILVDENIEPADRQILEQGFGDRLVIKPAR